MTITALTLTNPGAESGNTTGWTLRTGTQLSVASSKTYSFPSRTFTSHSGTYFFYRDDNDSASTTWDQTVDVSTFATAIDTGAAAVKGTAWHETRAGDACGLYLECYASDGTTLLGSSQEDLSGPTSWTQRTVYCALPVGTRFVRIGSLSTRTSGSGNLIVFWDDYALEISDSRSTDYPSQLFAPIATQVVAYAVASQTADEARALQIVPLTVSAAETSNGFYNVNVHQVVAYALVKGKVDRVDLRAWTFLQDDHLFYGLQLGSAGTIVYDILTQQWCQWYSPGYTYFRAEDVTDWEGYNLAADTENGTIWKIDPTGRLDEGTTVITSQVTGQATVRGRRTIPCYTAELACSQANPAGAGTSIQLRTSDDGAASWVDHGTVAGEAIGTSTLFRWYGLGTMVSPGRVFELTNAGYARRLDGLDLELGGSAGDVTSGQ